MRTALALAAALMLAAPAARADVTYIGDFTAQNIITGQSIPFLSTLTVSDAVVAGGSLNATVNCPGPTSYCPSPWPSGISGTFGVFGAFPQPTEYGSPDYIDLTFNPDGTLSGSLSLYLDQSNLDVHLTGGETSWGGSFGSDACNCRGTITSGFWLADPSSDPISVPAPSSFALLLPALAATIWSYHRRSVRVTGPGIARG